MKDLLDKILKPKKAEVKVKGIDTKGVVEFTKEETPKKVNPWPRPTHHPVCTCHKCIRWKEAENA